jgi:L-alanine-DL-glutamate epimerase-like enolase superfamily enzyme
MKIKKIEVFQSDLPYAGGVYHLSGGRSYESFDATFVCITTECGLQGWGESTPFGATYIAAHAGGVRAGLAEIAPSLIGANPCRVDRINDLMDMTLLGHAHAKTPIDVACWDIFGKATNMPVCDLLGGRTNDRLPVISSVHAGDPDDMRARVAEYRAKGYLGYSVKIGASELEGGPTLDVERIKASLADFRPGEYFIVDANGGLTVEHALRLLQLLPPGLDFVLEAPCATWRECLSLRQRTPRPIIFDELGDSDAAVAKIISSDAADGLGLKISKNGGLTKGRRQRDMSIAAGLTLSVQDTVGSEIAFAAVVHLGQTIPRRLLRCVLDTRDMVAQEIAAFDCTIENGGVFAPSVPGLGVTPNMAVLGEPVASYY